ncbi:MAG TPA: hypothetical protein DEP35_25025 [Deltaproteobacteria bacterium]|nr:hypothetical protein [Deltaproteobacteria bacterium]
MAISAASENALSEAKLLAALVGGAGAHTFCVATIDVTPTKSGAWQPVASQRDPVGAWRGNCPAQR